VVDVVLVVGVKKTLNIHERQQQVFQEVDRTFHFTATLYPADSFYSHSFVVLFCVVLLLFCTLHLHFVLMITLVIGLPITIGGQR